MAVNGENTQVKDSPSYIEVNCTSSNKIRRFSAGTKAGFALSLINRKLEDGLPLGLYIESVKLEEEPVSFGPSSVLVHYGDGWKLQTVTESEGGARARESIRKTTKHESPPLGLDELHSPKGLLPSNVGVGYIVKVVLAFVLLFLFGAMFTLALENLPSDGTLKPNAIGLFTPVGDGLIRIKVRVMLKHQSYAEASHVLVVPSLLIPDAQQDSNLLPPECFARVLPV